MAHASSRDDAVRALPHVQRRRHPLGETLEHRDVDALAAPRVFARVQRGEDRRVRVHSRRDVGDRHADLGGMFLAAGDRHDARFGLDEHVVRLLVAHRAVGPVAGNAAPDDARIARRHLLVPEAESLHGTRREIVHEHVGVVDQPRANLQIVGRLEVEHDAALAAIEPGEVRRRPVHRAVVGSRGIAAVRTFDLHDVGAKVGELTRTEGRGDRLLERDDAQFAQRHQNDRGMPSTCSPMYERIMFVDTGAT